jgi:periplasmic protein TonB
MTDQERIWTGIAISLFAHFAVLSVRLPDRAAPHAAHAAVPVNLTSSARLNDAGPGLGVEASDPGSEEQARAASMQRRAFLEYLDAVDETVHAHRLDGGATGLLGVATCSFSIGPDGAFRDIGLYSSSGHPELDRAALQAVRAASGRVRRPAIIGSEPIPVLLDVKYQYGLR